MCPQEPWGSWRCAQIRQISHRDAYEMHQERYHLLHFAHEEVAGQRRLSDLPTANRAIKIATEGAESQCSQDQDCSRHTKLSLSL